MTERPRLRASATSRKRRRLFRSPPPRLGESDALTALARAWTVTTIATTLLFAALVLAPIWDRATFIEALGEGLSNPEQMQAVVEPAADLQPAKTDLSRR